MSTNYDAILFASFGGPEGPDDVMPFLENVTRGRGVPRERLEVVAQQYLRFGGVSPINAQNRALIAALETELAAHDYDLPIYFGNRNWPPMMDDAMARMAADGVSNALAFVTSAYSSYSGCRQYREDIERARAKVGATAPEIAKLRAYWNHPGFIEPMVAQLQSALDEIPQEQQSETRVLFTAHSLPQSMAESSDYVAQLADAAQLIADGCGLESWDRVYQSRSGPPTQPWLEPDVADHIEALAGQGIRNVVVVPSGFISDHMEVLYDLDTLARERADELGVNMRRVPTVGTAPAFVSMIRELVDEQIKPGTEPRALGAMGPRPSVCAVDCCPAPKRPPASARPRGA
jgi:ferrochelatase